MDNFTDQEIISLLEALDIALEVSLNYPPQEESRLYTQMDALFQKLGDEALARGIHGYAEYDPEISIGRLEAGPMLDDNRTDVKQALYMYQDEMFWTDLTNNVAAQAAHAHITGCSKQLGKEERDEIFHDMRVIADKMFRNEGLRQAINTTIICERYLKEQK